MSFMDILKTITTEDDANKVADPVKLVWLTGAIIYMFAGLAFIIMGAITVWRLKTAFDYQSYGIGIAAWGGGFGTYVLTGAGALWAKAHADVVTGTTVVTKTTEKPPQAPVQETTVTETKPKES